MRPLLGNLFLVGFGCALGVGMLEVGARVVLSARPPGKSGEQAAYTMFDPILGWRNKPGASVTYNRREYRTTVAINALGFRDVERTVTKPADRSRVLVLGDSFIEGYSVERDETVTRRVETLAGQSGCPVDVVNAGVHGYSTHQEALWYVREGAPLDADVVVIAVYHNDIIYTVRTRYSGSITPLVEVRDGVITPVNTPLAEPPAETSPVKPAAQRSIEGSALRALVMERLFVGAPRAYGLLARLGAVEAYEPDSVPDELRVYKTRTRPPEIDAAWRRITDIFGSVAHTIRDRRAVPVMVYIPARFEVSDNAFEFTVARYGLDRTAWDTARVRTRLSEIAAATGFSFLDLTPPLLASVGFLNAEPYFPYDGHWNRKGHDVAARAILPFLRQRSLLACATTAS